MVLKSYKERVARGAMLLDYLVPGWHKKIDLDRLRLSSCTDCVCGQLAFTTASKAIKRELDYDPWDAWTTFRRYLARKLGRREKIDLAQEILNNPSHFGFVTIREGYPSLDREWRRVIEERLEETA